MIFRSCYRRTGIETHWTKWSAQGTLTIKDHFHMWHSTEPFAAFVGLCAHACKRVVCVCAHVYVGLSMCMLGEARRLCQVPFSSTLHLTFLRQSFLTEPKALANSATQSGWQLPRVLFSPHCTPHFWGPRCKPSPQLIIRLNLGPRANAAGTLLTELCPQPTWCPFK